MIFSAIAAVLNAGGWIAYYYFSGGWFEATETAEVRSETVAMMILASVIAGIVSAISKNLFDNPFYNILHILLSTTIISAPFYAAMYFDLSFWRIVVCFMLWSVAYFGYFVAFPFWFTNDYGGVPWWGRFLVVAIVVFGVTFYPEGKLCDFLLGPGFFVGIPISFFVGIKNTYFDFD